MQKLVPENFNGKILGEDILERSQSVYQKDTEK